jgi:DNA-binding response OmpR family regulator
LSDLALTGSETILVIEDESDIGNFLKTIFQDSGYHILLAQDYEEAMRLFNLNKETIEAVFSDISLPKVDGITLCSELKALKPSLKIILSSGFSSREFKARFDELGIEAFVPKPYNPHDILWNMRRALNGSMIFSAT